MVSLASISLLSRFSYSWQNSSARLCAIAWWWTHCGRVESSRIAVVPRLRILVAAKGRRLIHVLCWQSVYSLLRLVSYRSILVWHVSSCLWVTVKICRDRSHASNVVATSRAIRGRAAAWIVKHVVVLELRGHCEEAVLPRRC